MDFTPPPGLDLYESKQPELYAAYSSTYGLAVVAVALRLWCRLAVSKAGLWWDDYIICLALTIATGNYVDMIIWVYRGVGTHIYQYGMPGMTHFFLNLFVCEILYTFSICFTKYSILLFYWRIFKKTSIRIPIYILTFLVTGWGLGVLFTTIFQCIPTRGFWDKSITAHCGVNINNFFIGNAVPNIITDWVLLILPLPYVWNIQRSAIQKTAICGVFALGGFICIISIVRLIVMLEAYKVPSVDVTWVFVGPSTWTAVETNIGIVSACLPSLGPLLKRAKRNKVSYNYSDGSDFRRYPNRYGQSWASAKAGYSHHTNEGSEIHLAGIDVTTSVDIRRERHLQ
ncbi:putative integral membrane protein [Aspergillus lucknowensis]|uniref:Rhodopsin domain-containing protein n=1 Tax=Aspergillus lucknowensis TaxID=176173 RepID=A0ABR4LIW9_9EURO